MTPNPRLQRTPSAPLSRKPLGDRKNLNGNRIQISLVGLVAMVLLGSSRLASACSCLDPLTDPVRALARSGLVFSGEVTSVNVVQLPEVFYTKDSAGNLVPSQHMKPVGVVTLRTLKEWKGGGAPQYVVLAGAPPVTPLPQGTWLANCDVHLEVGRRYLIFTTEGFAEANYCSPTGELESRQSEIAALDAHAKASQVKKASRAKAKS